MGIDASLPRTFFMSSADKISFPLHKLSPAYLKNDHVYVGTNLDMELMCTLGAANVYAGTNLYIELMCTLVA